MFSGIPWWGDALIVFGIGIFFLWVIIVLVIIHFAAKHGKRMDEDFKNFSKRF